MNRAVKSISELIAGEYGKTILVGGKVYIMKAPAIKIIVRATRCFSQVDVPENAKVDDLMKAVSGQLDPILQGLSYLVVGDVADYELQSKRVVEEMRQGNLAEVCTAFQVAIDLIAGPDFFGVASSAQGLANLIVRSR